MQYVRGDRVVKSIIRSSNYWNLSKPLVKKLGIETAFLFTNLIEADEMMKTKDGWFFQTIEKLEDVTTLSRHKQDNSIKQLQEIGLIEVSVKGMPAKRYFKINEESLIAILFDNKQQTSLRNIDKLVCKKSATSKESTYKENIYKESNKDIVGKPDSVPYKKIIDYLNEVANKKYRHTTAKTKALIKARSNEGFTLDDFKKVIDVKNDEWKDDEKMQKFIRPETLFGTKFESYLNQQSKAPVDDGYDYGF